MFTNPFNRKYQTGGSASSKADSLIEKASKNSGISAKILIDKINSASSDKSNGAEFAELIKAAASDEDTQERRNAIASLKKKCKSPMFADGGKFQDFICKHGRGGDIGCGCNGGKVVRGEDGLPDIDPNSREARKVRRTARKADDLNGVTRRSTSYIETPEGKWGFEEGDVNGNTTETYFFAPNGSVPTQVDTPWVQKIYTPYGYRIVRGNQNSAGWTTLGPRVENILSQEDGGVLKGRGGMSTRSIFRIAQNQNEDNPSMRTIRRTYRDLKRQNLNAGMSRRDSKALARADILGPSQNFMDSLSDDIMANVDADINADTNIANSTLNQYLQNSNNNWNELLNRNSVQAVKPMDTSKYYNALSFGDAFNTARKLGHNTFQWRGKTYGTNTDPNWRSKWGLDNGTQSDWASEKENAIIRMNESTSTDATVPEQEPAPVFINGRFVNASIPQDIWTNSAITSRSANTPTSTYTSIPRRNYSAITGQALKPGQSSWDLFEQGGVLKGQQGLSRAAGYYQRHANEGIIRKLQNFLMGHGYYNGDLDGKFGNQTYEAIRQYQRDNGLTDDGMWGEDTNEVHRVLGAGDTTFNGSRSGAHPGKHTYGDNFVNKQYITRGSVKMSDINNVIEKAIVNPEWFWGDSDDAKAWRLLLENGSPDGKGGTNYGAILEDIWRETPDEIKSRIPYNKLPNSIKSAVYNQGVSNAINNSTPYVMGALTLPALANPLATAGAVTGAGLLGAAGRNVGSDMQRLAIDPETGQILGYVNQNNKPSPELVGFSTPTVIPDQSNNGEGLGQAIGTVLGAGIGNAANNAIVDLNYNPTGVEMKLGEPKFKLIKDYKSVKPKGGGGKRTGGDPSRFSGKGAKWIRRMTGQPIEDYEVSGYILERKGGRIKKCNK